ncbi:MAG: sigma-54-dependent Fis family transcriptional regulator [Parafilimonas sp.]|nr:sigma-54-dependent Fis family transcriptional regulator [Parafilimonas sp.]
MIKKDNHTHLWFIDLSSHNILVDKLSAFLKRSNIILNKFTTKSEEEFGIILVEGNECYEQLISLLNVQLKSRNNRIIILNISQTIFEEEEVFKILNYGAEYFFELAMLDDEFDCIAEKIQRWRNIESIMESSIVRRTIIGESLLLKKLLRNLIEVAVYSTASILILGERGTGKELIARLVHDLSDSKRQANMVLVDCTTIKPQLSGSEFFGHEKGSYTGADNTREGAFALAHNGTLFLDEVGELPMQMQAELLRVIQEGAYKKIGSNTWKQTSFRLIAATNRNLETEAEAGNFRKDLYDRISLWKCYMPCLNERKEDIPMLIEFFLKKHFPDKLPHIGNHVIQYLKERNYPGNIRELQNIVKRICLRYVGKGPITLGDIPEYDRTQYSLNKNVWFENNNLSDCIKEALNTGYDAKSIIDRIKNLTTNIALSVSNNNREVSQLLGKSERWIQLQKAKEK